jgi:hypothetical protein
MYEQPNTDTDVNGGAITVNSLPHDVLFHIFKYTTDAELFYHIPMTCRHFRRCLKHKLAIKSSGSEKFDKYSCITENILWKERLRKYAPSIALITEDQYFCYRNLYKQLFEVNKPRLNRSEYQSGKRQYPLNTKISLNSNCAKFFQETSYAKNSWELSYVDDYGQRYNKDEIDYVCYTGDVWLISPINGHKANFRVSFIDTVNLNHTLKPEVTVYVDVYNRIKQRQLFEFNLKLSDLIDCMHLIASCLRLQELSTNYIELLCNLWNEIVFNSLFYDKDGHFDSSYFNKQEFMLDPKKVEEYLQGDDDPEEQGEEVVDENEEKIEENEENEEDEEDGYEDVIVDNRIYGKK